MDTTLPISGAELNRVEYAMMARHAAERTTRQYALLESTQYVTSVTSVVGLRRQAKKLGFEDPYSAELGPIGGD